MAKGRKPKTTVRVGGGKEHDFDTEEGKEGFKQDLGEAIGGIGHNSAGKRITEFVERVERLEKEKTDLGEDITQVLKEADAAGFDKKIIRTIVKIRKDKAAFERDLATVETYMSAMGDQLAFHFEKPETDPIEDLGDDREAA